MSKKKKQANIDIFYDDSSLCDKMSFSMSESFKMLRTKLSLTLPQEEGQKKCNIIGITSAMKGEGKTQTAINLAYSFAEAQNKTLLIEADMRLPNMQKRLVLKRPAVATGRQDANQGRLGLSNLLVGQASDIEVIQNYKSARGISFDVIVGGDIPPMPSELLGSEQMKAVLQRLSKEYQYIILDLPPVSIVTDAIAVSTVVDGYVVVVRRNACDQRALEDTMYQLRLVNAKLLGCVFNGSDSNEKGEYRRGSKYYYGYGYGYEHRDASKKG